MQESEKKSKTTDLRLRERDLAVLRWMCQQYAARMDHLEALIGRRRKVTDECVRRLRAAEFVRSERIVVGQPTWVIPTHKGAQACGLRYWLWKPRLGALTHVCAINDVRLHIQAQKPESTWLPERQLLAEAKAQTSTISHVPDGVLLVDGHRIAIEVELTAKTVSRLEAILDAHTRRYDGILYYCAKPPRSHLRALEESGRWRKLGVRELPRPLGPEWL